MGNILSHYDTILGDLGFNFFFSHFIKAHLQDLQCHLCQKLAVFVISRTILTGINKGRV